MISESIITNGTDGVDFIRLHHRSAATDLGKALGYRSRMDGLTAGEHGEFKSPIGIAYYLHADVSAKEGMRTIYDACKGVTQPTISDVPGWRDTVKAAVREWVQNNETVRDALIASTAPLVMYDLVGGEVRLAVRLEWMVNDLEALRTELQA